MAYNAGLGDVAGDIAAELERLRAYASTIQAGGDALAARIAAAGTQAVKISNAVTGAVAGANYGAQAGYNAPTTGALPRWVVPTALIGGAFLLLRRR